MGQQHNTHNIQFIIDNCFIAPHQIKMDITLDDQLNVLQQISQEKLVKILETIPGMKDLIIEQRLIKILDSFVGLNVLK